jgi:hypothetical protein
MVRNLWNPLSPMHYGAAAANLSKDVIYHSVNKTFLQGKKEPWLKDVPCTLAGREDIEGLNCVIPDAIRQRTQVSTGRSR